jgi:NADPH-dependent ferric siderophore reductase
MTIHRPAQARLDAVDIVTHSPGEGSEWRLQAQPL